MVVAQKTKEAEITEQDSLLLTRNLLRIAIFNISYIRGLFPEKYFNDKSVPALEMKIKKLMPMDMESRRLIDWMEKGVYDALQKKYLKTLLFCICEQVAGPMIEEYAFSFSYPNADGEDVAMNVSRTGSKKGGATFKSNTAQVNPDQMRSAACKMVRTLVQLMQTLDQMPEERTILMKLLYYDDATPADYEPPFFRSCTENEINNTWVKNPLKMAVGDVNSKHIVLALKVRSILDPCEDENEEHPEDENASLADNSVHEDDSSSDDDVHPSRQDQYIIAPAGEKRQCEETGTHSEDDTQDAAHEEEQVANVRQWITDRHVNNVDVVDILSNFPNISMALAEDIVEKLLNEGVLLKGAKDTYTINRELDVNMCDVKQEEDMQDISQTDRAPVNTDDVDYMYMKALYHALPMDYITVSKLQSKLEGEANQTTVRKLIDKMMQEGFVKNSGNRKLGKCVIHSELSNKRFMEVKKVLEFKSKEMKTNGKLCDIDASDPMSNGHAMKDGSTYGGLHSIGSDLTRTRGRSETTEIGFVRTAKEQCNTPVSKIEAPISSVESGILRKDNEKGRGRVSDDSSHSTQDKKRKASTVKEPIFQHVKRLKSQAQ